MHKGAGGISVGLQDRGVSCMHVCCTSRLCVLGSQLSGLYLASVVLQQTASPRPTEEGAVPGVQWEKGGRRGR